MKKSDFIHPFISTTETYSVQYMFSVPFMRWLLEFHHPANRQPSRNRVESVIDDMRENRWNPKAGTLIRFNRKGQLIDGQHRLLAAIELGKPFISSVQFGLPDKAILCIDTNRSRSAADNATLGEASEKNERPTDDLFKLNRLQHRITRWVISGMKWMNGIAGARAHQSNAALLAAITKFKPAISFAMDGATSKHTKRPGYASALAMYYMKHPHKAIKFREQMTKGTGACEQVVQLRDYLLSAAGGGNSPIYDHFNTVAVINAFHHNKPVEGRLGNRLKTSWNV